MNTKSYDAAQTKELMLQALEAEMGGIKVYETAIRCAITGELRSEWTACRELARHRANMVAEALESVGIDAREAVEKRMKDHYCGRSLVWAMEAALAEGDKRAAQAVACECIVLAESECTSWSLLTDIARHGCGDQQSAFEAAYNACDHDDSDQLKRTRELWMGSLGFDGMLPFADESEQQAFAFHLQ